MKPAAEAARVLEVFSSIQGEGARLGERQIFVRFGGCNLLCGYCDEPKSIPRSAGEVRGSDSLKEDILRLCAQRPHTAVSWTGGEPLLFASSGMMAWARAGGWRTAWSRTLANELRRVAALAVHLHGSSSLPTPGGFRAHRDFLSVAPKTFVKTILTENPGGRVRSSSASGGFPKSAPLPPAATRVHPCVRGPLGEGMTPGEPGSAQALPRTLTTPPPANGTHLGTS